MIFLLGKPLRLVYKEKLPKMNFYRKVTLLGYIIEICNS